MYLRREAREPWPWTADPILQQFRFCNVFREDDRVTKWFKDKVRQPLHDWPEVVFATVAFRFFNTIPTGEVMLEQHLFTDWDPDVARDHLSDLKPLITGAYMVKTPVGVAPKLEGLIQILDPIWEDRGSLYEDINGTSLQLAHRRLMKYPWVGPFMAYEIVTDLRHTHALSGAGDINSWANPGPGATRGLQRVSGRKMNEEERLHHMRYLLDLAHREEYWPSQWPEWEMREVEHVLCEFDKFERFRLGEGRPKQRYGDPT